MASIAEGQLAPDFTLPASTGGEITLSDYRGKKSVVLYFYPKDDTPGCTTEACSFRDAGDDYDALDAQVLGVSRDSVKSHEAFAGKYSLPFPLLSDSEGTVTEQYGVWREKNMYGKKTMGIARTTVIIGKDGVIRKIFPKVKVDGHSAEVREALQQLQIADDK